MSNCASAQHASLYQAIKVYENAERKKVEPGKGDHIAPYLMCSGFRLDLVYIVTHHLLHPETPTSQQHSQALPPHRSTSYTTTTLPVPRPSVRALRNQSQHYLHHLRQ